MYQSRSFIALASALLFSLTVTAQERFRSGIDLVTVDVCAKDRQGRPVGSLRPEDVVVLDNGVPQQIALFSADGRVPVAVTLLVDTSQSMRGGQIEHAKAAAAELVDALRPEDLVEVISFNDQPSVRYPLGGDHTAAKQALDNIAAKGPTALFETVLFALNDQERARRTREDDYREVIVLLSDGENTVGHVRFEDVLEEVRRSGSLVYTISLPSTEGAHSGAPPWQMAQLAFDTGGQAIAVRGGEDLAEVYRAIAEDVLHLYRVGYVPSPSGPGGDWHRIQVRVPAKDLVIRARAGYYAADR